MPLPSPPAVEHHYNPDSRTVHTTYTCMDGYRSITLTYGAVPKGQVSMLSRNGIPARQSVVDEVNRMLARLSIVSSLYPQCGSKDDILFVSGMAERERSTLLIAWSPDEARLDLSELE